jgi:protoporphyrinogen oxidase
MTWFDIKKLHAPALDEEVGAVLEVDFYHSNALLAMSDEEIVAKAKADLDTMLGEQCRLAKVVDAAVVKLPNAVNW